MANSFSDRQVGLESPAFHAYAVTPHDSTDFAQAFRALYVGVTGNVVIITVGGETVTFTAVPAGMILPVAGVRVNSTNTTATSIVGLY